MLWSLYVPLAYLLIFAAWMLRITWRARSSLGQTNLEISQLENVLKDLKANRRESDTVERWLGETYAFIAKNSYSKQNPVIELINRFYAMRDLASPNVFAALDSISNRELDKLEGPRETPNSLLLLGIMGTVVGMVTALSTFGVIGARDATQTIDIGRIIGSMFVAFISTGLALVFSVTTRGYVEKVTMHQSDMLAELEGYAFTHLAPLLLPKQDRVAQQRFHELMDHQQTLLGESLEKGATTLDNFAASIEQTQHITHLLNETMSKNATVVGQLGQRITSDLNTVSSDVSSKLLQSLQVINKDLTQHRAGLEGSFKDARTILEEEKRLSLQQSELLQRRIAETIEVLRENNNTLVKSFNTMTSHYATYTERQTASIEALRQEVTALSDRLVSSQEVYQQTFFENVQSFLRGQFDELARTLGLGRRR
jgi:biopolymer transport protein ExbB/TolQ